VGAILGDFLQPHLVTLMARRNRGRVGNQGCQIAYFQTKNPDFGKFWRVLQWKILVYFWPFGPFYGYLVYFMVIWDIFWLFGMFL
jgi:hypothetical protein